MKAATSAEFSSTPNGRLAALVNLAFFLLVGHAMSQSMGQYAFSPIFWLSIALLGLIAVFFAAPMARFRENEQIPLLLGACVIQVMQLAFIPRILYAAHAAPSFLILRVLLFASLALAIAPLVRRDFAPDSRRTVIELGGSLALLLICQGLTLFASPDPKIDVFTVVTEGADRFLRGVLPYGYVYPDIYGGRYDYQPIFVYPPGLLYFAVIGRKLFGDIRAAYVLASLGTCYCLWKLAREKKLSPVLQAGVVLLWVSVPTTLFVLEQSFVDIPLVFLSALFLLFLSRGAWLACGLTLGYQLATKQYGVILAFLLFVWLGLRDRRQALRELGRLTAGIALSSLLLFVPFLVMDASGLYRNIVTDIMGQRTRLDAFTWTALAAQRWHWSLPGWSHWVPVLLLLAVLGGRWAARRSLTEMQWLQAVGIFYAVLFLTAKQAFCNYYYYMSFFLFAATLWSLTPTPPLRPPIENG